MPLDPLISPTGFRARMAAIPRLAVFLGLIVLLVGVNILQTLSLVLKLFSNPAFRRVNRWGADKWWGSVVAASKCVNRTRFIISGDELPAEEKAIVVANHQQMPDIIMLMALARSKKRLGDLKFFVKNALRWVPGVGWGMHFLDCLFIRRDWASDRDSIARTFAKIVNHDIPLWLVSFVEGTRIKPGKLAASQAYAIESGLQPLRHLLVPRTKGFAASVRGLRDHIDVVYDVTIGYVDGVPNLTQWSKGYVRRAHMYVRRYPVGDLPDNDDGLRQWLIDRFNEKDELLEIYYQTGAFPGAANAAEATAG